MYNGRSLQDYSLLDVLCSRNVSKMLAKKLQDQGKTLHPVNYHGFVERVGRATVPDVQFFLVSYCGNLA